MKGLPNAVRDDLQTVYNLADILVDLCNEDAKEKLLGQIKGIANKIKKISSEYNK